MSHGRVPLAEVAVWAVLMLAIAGCGSGGGDADGGGSALPRSTTEDAGRSAPAIPPPSSNEDGSAPEIAPPSDRETPYTAQAETICKEEMARFAAVGDGSSPTLENMRRVMKQQAAVLETLRHRLSDLNPPERVESDVDQMLRSYASAAAGSEKVSEAGSMAEAERRFEEHVAPNLARAIQTADAIGIESCEG